MDLNERQKQLLRAKLKAAGVKTIQGKCLRLKSREKFYRTSVLAGTGYLDEATADVEIICENGQVAKAHKIILCLASEFFTNMFQGQNPDNRCSISIPDIGIETMIMILTLVYKNDELKLTEPTKNKVQEWLEIFGLSNRIVTEVELSDHPPEQNQEEVQMILPYPVPEERMRQGPEIPVPKPTAKPVQQQQVAVAGPSRNAYAQQLPGISNRNNGMPDDSATEEPPHLERMTDFDEPSSSYQVAKKHVRFAKDSPEVSNRSIFPRASQSEPRKTAYEPETMRVEEPVKRKRGRPRKTSEAPEQKQFKTTSAAAGSARQARAQSERARSSSPYGRRATRSRSRSRSKNRFEDTSDRVEEPPSAEDYSGEKRAKLLGANPKCSRLKAMLKGMKK